MFELILVRTTWRKSKQPSHFLNPINEEPTFECLILRIKTKVEMKLNLSIHELGKKIKNTKWKVPIIWFECLLVREVNCFVVTINSRFTKRCAESTAGHIHCGHPTIGATFLPSHRHTKPYQDVPSHTLEGSLNIQATRPASWSWCGLLCEVTARRYNQD